MYAVACRVLNEQECVHKRLSSPLHLGTLHGVFVQMISLARRQPNYLSSSVSGKPKRTSTYSRTHTPVHIPQGCLSATLLHYCVMEAITLLLIAGSVELGWAHFAPRCSGRLRHHSNTICAFVCFLQFLKMCTVLRYFNALCVGKTVF